MTCWLRCLLPCLSLWLVVTPAVQAAEPITLESLLAEMTNRESIARWPHPTYTCRQASSYDRKSVDPADQVAWFANADRSQWVRIEEREVDGKSRREFVMMDEEGPGAIVRFWGTWHGPSGQPFSNGTLRVYLDGNETPAIEGPIQEVLDQGRLASGPLSEGVSPETPYGQRGHNLYLPIPYAQHCKITYSTDVFMDQGAQRGEAVYYQINYRTYEKGATVETFTMEALQNAKDSIAEAQTALLEVPTLDHVSAVTERGALPAGESTELTIDGARAIMALSVKLDANDLPQALRSTVLKMEFDGQPCVWVPVGDFFGIGYQPSTYRTFYTEVNDEGVMRCWWVMPFAKSARVTLENLGTQPVQAELQAEYAPWRWDERSMYFHAAWHELYKAETRRGSERAGDGAYNVNYVTIDGQGVYAGDTLSVFNGAAAWWGEGDETVYVDGESFPSHFGTGTEDYYGYAWCRPEKFESPFHAQPTGDGNLAGGFSVNSRYRALDAIPFRQSLKFDMELWHWADTLVNFSPAVFYYARPGSASNKAPDPAAAARPITRSRGEMGTVYAVEGAMEGEELRVVSTSAGRIERQQSGNWGWSNEHQLWWRDAGEGDELVLEIDAEKSGVFEVSANLTKAPDYARVALSFNDDTESVEFDRYHPQVAADKVELGTVRLRQGANQLRIRILGHNTKAEPRGMFGLDYIQLTPK